MTYKTHEELTGHIERENNAPLIPGQPPWVIRVYKKAQDNEAITGEECAVFVRVHHALCDGHSLYITLLPVFFDMKPVPNCSDAQFLASWKRSTSGLGQVARALELYRLKEGCMNQEESTMDVVPQLDQDIVTTRSWSPALRCSMAAFKALVELAATNVLAFVLIPYAILWYVLYTSHNFLVIINLTWVTVGYHQVV
jgi:hypothetical protein